MRGKLILLYWKLCFLCLFKSTNTNCGSLEFNLVTNYAPWLGRYQAQIHVLQNPMDYNSTIFPAGSFLLYGGSADRYLRSVVNDVWLSSDRGQSWVRTDSNWIFPIFPRCTFFNDPTTDRSYAISNDNYKHENILPIWTTTTQNNWTSIVPLMSNISSPMSPFTDRYGFSCSATRNSAIYCMMGMNQTRAMNQTSAIDQNYSDVWTSQNYGATWNLKAANLTVPGRSNALTGVHINNIHLGGRDVIYIIGGQSSNSSEIVDLWASSDAATTWIQLSQPPWPGTASMSTLQITKDGILLISVYTHVSNQYTSEIWTSLDGGYSWGQCLRNASYKARILPGLIVDSDGFLYIIGVLGTTRPPRIFYNDVWKSSLSVYQWDQLANACNTTVPIGGVGMRFWPGVFYNSSSSSSGSYLSNFSSSSSSSHFLSSSSWIGSSGTHDSGASRQPFATWIIILIGICGTIIVVILGLLCIGCQKSPRCRELRTRCLSRTCLRTSKVEEDSQVGLMSEDNPRSL